MSEGVGHSGRRRSSGVHRRPSREGPNLEKILFFVVLALGPLALGVWWMLRDPPPALPPAPLNHLAEVRSTITQDDDSLQLIVDWEIAPTSPFSRVDSMRVAVVLEPDDTLVVTQPPDQAADTVQVALPAPGQTAIGYSCVAAHYATEPIEQNCTPWQYVRPAAVSDTTAQVKPKRIVIQPSGLQVDPDLEGTCARWQETHPIDSVWIVVNRKAIPECTGPNLKPIVAQFCAFAVLPDGRRVKTANSVNNRYCDELFEEWIRERFS